MFAPYSIFLRRAAAESLKAIRGSRRHAVEKFLDYLSDNPFYEGDFTETDSTDRRVFCKIVRDYAISYYPDHPAKEIKILEIVRTP